jgi:hypothetical protein
MRVGGAAKPKTLARDLRGARREDPRARRGCILVPTRVGRTDRHRRARLVALGPHRESLSERAQCDAPVTLFRVTTSAPEKTLGAVEERS